MTRRRATPTPTQIALAAGGLAAGAGIAATLLHLSSSGADWNAIAGAVLTGAGGVVRLSPNFTLAEGTVSDTAVRLGLDNTPTAEQIAEIRWTAGELERIRSAVGAPLHVESWWRSPAVNQAVGGTATSDHLTGRAVDFWPIGRSASDAFEHLRARLHQFPAVDQLLYYEDRGHIHVGFRRSGARGQVGISNGGSVRWV